MTENPPAKKTKHLGRRSKLNDEVAKQICAILASGGYQKTACAAVGIPAQTFYVWMEKGEHQTEGKYHDFHEAVKRAEHAAELRWIRTISEDDSWQSKAWLLERRYPDRWGRKAFLQAQVDGQVQVNFTPIQQLSEEEWKTKIVNDPKNLPPPDTVN